MPHDIPPLPAHDDFVVEGLRDTVEIAVDRWGVPHISAASQRDAFVAQGFNAARDRLFQIDLWRRRGNGLLAEALGPEYVEQDRANRLLLYRGSMEDEWAAYGEGVRETVEAFVVGINAYVGWAMEAPEERLPPEFLMYGYQPAYWDAADAVRFRTHGLFYNAEQEVSRARVLTLAGEQSELVRQAREPADPLIVPDGVDLGIFGPDVLRTYLLAFAPVNFAGAVDPADARESTSGSNNWVVSAERTATGRPILANDPHRAVSLPSLRYVAHLTAPGMDVIGAGEPGLPGISIGHNGHVAFGLTIWPADMEDLYVYDLDPADPSRYLGPQGSTPFTIVTESVPVRGGVDAAIELAYTVHGPVIHVDHDRGVAVALRAAWLEPGMAPYVGSIRYDTATTGDEFLAALETWGAPAVNQVFATADGDWGWQAAARIPRRRGWDGSVPVPGDGRYEWDGFASTPDLPQVRREDPGWFASANEMNLPEEWDNSELTITYDWYSFARASRVKEWLAADDAVSIASSVAMQRDEFSPHARALIAEYASIEDELLPGSSELAALRAWDGVTSASSREALVFEIWARRHLRPALVGRRLDADGVAAEHREEAARLVMKDESFGGDLRGDLRLARWLIETADVAEIAEIVERTLAAAIADIVQLLGEESPGAPWTWGALHHSSVTHAAYVAQQGSEPSWVRQGPSPRGGTGDTVGMAGYDGAFRQSIGSTFRVVVDVGEWDSSVAINSPGQSGDPRSPHYADLYQPWVDGEVFPLAYSPAAVEAATAARITLRPA